MRTTLDGVLELEQRCLKVGGWQRGTIERAVAGLDGVLSIDLGRRGRELLQKGFLRANSEKGLDEKIAGIWRLMDGREHSLVVQDGGVFGNLRLDAFEAGKRVYGGGGVCCDFEIKYTQLKES